jgi:hypothetical protein
MTKVKQIVKQNGCGVEPPDRIELSTDGLRNRCSAAELRWH